MILVQKTYQKSSAVKTIFVKTIYTSGVFSIVAWLALVTVFVNTIDTTVSISLLFGFLTLDNFILVPLCEGTVR